MHDKTTIDLFLAFSTLLTKKKEEFSKSHTTILRDEYKIEDMMVIVREALVESEQLCLQDLFKETKDLQEVITLFLATLELIKTQEILLIQKESFGDIYLMKKNEENQVEQSQA